MKQQRSGIYRSVGFRVDGKLRTALVHRVVCEAFNGPPFDGAEVRHVDGDPSNNSSHNLRWSAKNGKPHPQVHKDMTGYVAGRLRVIERAENAVNGDARWACLCVCGTRLVVLGRSLRAGASTSCGCARKDALAKARTKHGMSKSSEYRIWCGILRRCADKSSKKAHLYAGRGISVCDRWASSFDNFYADMGPRPGPGFSVDRYPDQDGNYEPGNCRWATGKQQARNMRSSRMVKFGDERITVAELAERHGLRWRTVSYRIEQGWPMDLVVGSQKFVRGKKEAA